MDKLISAFSFNNLLRILIPGIYITLLINDILSKFEIYGKVYLENDNMKIQFYIIFIIFSVLFGGLFFLVDIPYLFKNCYKELPTNKLKSKIPYFFDKEYEFIRKYWLRYYYTIEKESKIQAEIHSGYFYLFFTLSAISFSVLIIHILLFIIFDKSFIFIFLNLLIFILSTISFVIILKFKLKLSWQILYEILLNDKKKKEELSLSEDISEYL